MTIFRTYKINTDIGIRVVSPTTMYPIFGFSSFLSPLDTGERFKMYINDELYFECRNFYLTTLNLKQ